MSRGRLPETAVVAVAAPWLPIARRVGGRLPRSSVVSRSPGRSLGRWSAICAYGIRWSRSGHSCDSSIRIGHYGGFPMNRPGVLSTGPCRSIGGADRCAAHRSGSSLPQTIEPRPSLARQAARHRAYLQASCRDRGLCRSEPLSRRPLLRAGREASGRDDC